MLLKYMVVEEKINYFVHTARRLITLLINVFNSMAILLVLGEGGGRGF